MAKIDLEQLKTKIRRMSSEENRNDGNPHNSKIDLDRELDRGGINTTPDDILLQDTKKRGVKINGNVPSATFIPSTTDTGGVYKLGTLTRPTIRYDPAFSNRQKASPNFLII